MFENNLHKNKDKDMIKLRTIYIKTKMIKGRELQ